MNYKKSPWAWVPTLYFAEGVPYVAVMTISLIMYKRLGLSNADITLYTSWLYLPWVIKPLWSPFVDIMRTKRWWVITMQLLIAASLGGVAFTIPGPFWLQGSLCFFWLMAFSSATHDIAADGFYMLGLDQHEQAYFVGIRSTFYRIATIFSSGLLVGLAGALQVMTRSIRYSWSLVFYLMAGLFIAFWLYHNWALPRVEQEQGDEKRRTAIRCCVISGRHFRRFSRSLRCWWASASCCSTVCPRVCWLRCRRCSWSIIPVTVVWGFPTVSTDWFRVLWASLA